MEQSKKILIVDDEAIHLEFLKDTVTQWGFSVFEATNGKEMIEVAKHSRPNLIILDVFMPNMDGYSALTHLRGMPKIADVPVILMSAHSGVKANIDILMAFENVEFLPKPIDIDVLIKKLNKMGFNI